MSSGSVHWRIAPDSSHVASSMLRPLITGPYVSAESASWEAVAEQKWFPTAGHRMSDRSGNAAPAALARAQSGSART
jgi:hypothetical protein